MKRLKTSYVALLVLIIGFSSCNQLDDLNVSPLDIEANQGKICGMKVTKRGDLIGEYFYDFIYNRNDELTSLEQSYTFEGEGHNHSYPVNNTLVARGGSKVSYHYDYTDNGASLDDEVIFKYDNNGKLTRHRKLTKNSAGRLVKEKSCTFLYHEEGALATIIEYIMDETGRVSRLWDVRTDEFGNPTFLQMVPEKNQNMPLFAIEVEYADMANPFYNTSIAQPFLQKSVIDLKCLPLSFCSKYPTSVTEYSMLTDGTLVNPLSDMAAIVDMADRRLDVNEGEVVQLNCSVTRDGDGSNTQVYYTCDN